MNNDFKEMLDAVSQTADDKKFRKINKLKKPQWLKNYKKDRLNEIYKEQEHFWSDGKIAIGCVVQANVRLFSLGLSDNSPANLVYTYDDYYYENAIELREIAEKLYNLRECDDELDEDRNYIAHLLNAETKRDYHILVPKDMTDGREVFLTTAIVDRDHIPYHKLCNFFYPMLAVDNNNSPDAIILPKWYWKGRFIYDFNFFGDNKICPVMPEKSVFNLHDMITIGAGRSFRKEHPLAHIFFTLMKWLAVILPLYTLFKIIQLSPLIPEFEDVSGTIILMFFIACLLLSAGMISFIGSFMEQYMGDRFTKCVFITGAVSVLVGISIILMEKYFN